jgi:iron complex transport system substrate-binding protein
MKKRQHIPVTTLLLISTMLAALLLAGCTPSAPPAEPGNQPAQTTPLPEEPDTAVRIVDALDRTITFEEPPQRIVLAGKALFMVADAMYAFPEALERLVATGDTGQSGSDNFIAQIDPAYPEKEVLDGEAGAEQIAATNPDAVVLKSFLAESLGAPLEALGIPVVYVSLETPEQYTRDLAILGALFQNETRAGELLSYYQNQVFRVTQPLAGLPEADKPSVLLLYYSDRDGEVAFSVPPMPWIQTIMVQEAGGVPVWVGANPGGGWAKVSLEQVAAWDADVVLIVSYFRNPDEVVAELQANPQWQQLRAVQNDRLIAFPGDFYSWDQPDTRWILGQMWLAKALHPDKYPDLDLQAELVDFYDRLYGLGADFVEQQVQPRLKGDL